MSLSLSTVISRALVLGAIGACLPLIGLVYAAIAFSGPPTAVMDYVAFGISVTFWLPAAASWKFPVAGFVAFTLLFGIALTMCVSSGSSTSECFYSLVFQLIGWAFLVLNLLFIYVRRRLGA